MEVYSPMWRQPDGTEGFARRPIIRGLIIPKAVEAAMNEFRTENSLDVEKFVGAAKRSKPKIGGSAS
jgi:hypothetical protein